MHIVLCNGCRQNDSLVKVFGTNNTKIFQVRKKWVVLKSKGNQFIDDQAFKGRHLLLFIKRIFGDFVAFFSSSSSLIINAMLLSFFGATIRDGHSLPRINNRMHDYTQPAYNVTSLQIINKRLCPYLKRIHTSMCVSSCMFYLHFYFRGRFAFTRLAPFLASSFKIVIGIVNDFICPLKFCLIILLCFFITYELFAQHGKREYFGMLLRYISKSWASESMLINLY